jgi:hypothetical protein
VGITIPESGRPCSGPRSRKSELALRRIDTDNFNRSTARNVPGSRASGATRLCEPLANRTAHFPARRSSKRALSPHQHAGWLLDPGYIDGYTGQPAFRKWRSFNGIHDNSIPPLGHHRKGRAVESFSPSDGPIRSCVRF